jgi:hypothetical protein
MSRSFRLVLFMGLPFFRGAVPPFCAVFLYAFGRCPFCVSCGSSFCPITPPCGFYPCFYFIEECHQLDPAESIGMLGAFVAHREVP